MQGAPQALSMVKAMASASRGTPSASATSRSNPRRRRRSPAVPPSSAASRCSSSGGSIAARAARRRGHARNERVVRRHAPARESHSPIRRRRDTARSAPPPAACPASARERRLRGRVVVDEAGPIAPQLRPDHQAHQQIEPRIAIELGMADDAVAGIAAASFGFARAHARRRRHGVAMRPIAQALGRRRGGWARAGRRAAIRPRSSAPHRRTQDDTIRCRVNSGLCQRPRSASRNTLQIW